jgi:uncharacterized protein
MRTTKRRSSKRIGPICVCLIPHLLLATIVLLGGCNDSRANGPAHQRLKWKAEDFFTDPGVVSLCRAIEAADIAEIDRLVKSGVNVNAKGRANMTPLLWAFPMGENVFKKMLELGADPNVKLTTRVWTVRLTKGDSVVSASASPELIEGPVHEQYFYDAPMDNYLKLVLQHGGNPNIEDAKGNTPLYNLRLSAPQKLEERISMLLKAGAAIDHRNKQGETAVVSGVYWQAAYVLCLLKAGADYRIADNDGADLVLWLERQKLSLEEQMSDRPNNPIAKLELAAGQPVFDWLAKEGVNWDAARAVMKSPEAIANLKSLPGDFKHRPWLPQRPTLKKPNANNTVKEK